MIRSTKKCVIEIEKIGGSIMNNLNFKPFASSIWDWDSLFNGFSDLEALSSGALKMKVVENENEYTLVAEVPGLKDDQINVTYEDGVISVEANYGEKKEGKEGKSFRVGKYSRTYRLSDIDRENIKAELKDGILTVKLQKIKASSKKSKKIEINKV